MIDRCTLRKVFCMVAALGTFAVAGCGGGGGVSGGVSGGSTTVSGVVADGYLEKATVFLDLNDDKQFTAGEPTAVTKADGTYTLENVTAADLKTHAIVVIAEKTVTINHEGNTSTPVADKYILSTPPDAPKNPEGKVVITPLTTLIHNQIETNPVLKVAEAEAVVKSNLGVATATSLFEDFVQKKGASADYDKVSKVAQVVATAIGNNMTAIKAAAPTANLNDVIKVIVAEVVNQLTTIANTVDTTSTSNFNAATIATTTVNVDTTNSTTLQQNLTQASAPAAVSSFQTALGTDGFFWIDRRNDNMQSVYYEYGVVKLGALGASGYALTEDYFVYTALNPTWAVVTRNDNSYVLSKDGWKLANDNASAGTLVFNADGTATWTITTSGESEVITVSKINVAGKLIGPFITKDNAPFNADAAFPAGAEAYKMTFVPKSDRYSIWAGNDTNTSLMAIKAVSDMPSTFAVGGTGMGLYIGRDFSVKFTGTGTSGAAQFYVGQQQQLLAITGAWKIVEPVAGYQVFVLDVPFAYKAQYMYDNPSRGVIFASVNGAVKQGSVEYANVPRMDGGLNFNKIAFDAIKANFTPTWSSPVVNQVLPVAKRVARKM